MYNLSFNDFVKEPVLNFALSLAVIASYLFVIE